MKRFFEKIIGTYSDRELKKIYPMVEKINSFEETTEKLSDYDLRAKTEEFKRRLSEGETLDGLLPEAFAVVREASRRVLGMRHFDVQLIGGIVLHQGRIAEMKTGEGKTLVATLPAYLNALTGQGVHIVTVNDYLAKRDSEWMGKVYNFLGLSVGLIINSMTPLQRKDSYAADITYGTNNEMGFDYLRDNMAIYKEQQVQRGHAYAIVDEVDSILVDEARTPLIISGQGDKSTEYYMMADKIARGLKKHVMVEANTKEHDDQIDADYIVDEKANTATLTERGVKTVEKAFGVTNLSDPENMLVSHHINQAIKAHGCMKRDIEYVVKDGQVLIVDEFTGRIMIGRRWSDGLHQAVEAKERVRVENESKTLATITFQNYFRLYKKLAGMTGTAQTEEDEFQAIYKLDVVVIPTNKPLSRVDHPDSVYTTLAGKKRAIVKQIQECYAKGQPVLVGTVSVEKSEDLSAELKKAKIPHEVLNAKYHDKEAEIVAQAGKRGVVTIATNMAGRGTDIILGGNAEFMAKNQMRKMGISEENVIESNSYFDTDDEEILAARRTFKELYEKYKEEIKSENQSVLDAGGLFIIGTERHDSRRIDNQLCGRAGRQGDPGESKFFISLEDDLMRLFGADKVTGLYDKLGVSEDMPMEMGLLTRQIENAQKRVEGRNFDARKHVLEYDDVMNVQREIIYGQRQKVLEGESLQDVVRGYTNQVVESIIGRIAGSAPYSDEWAWDGFFEQTEFVLGIRFDISAEKRKDITREELSNMMNDAVSQLYERKESEFGAEQMRELERVVLLRVVDQKWMDHIDAMHQLRQGIGLRAYAQRDPIVEYKFEGMGMFEEMIEAIKEDAVRYILHAAVNKQHKRTAVAQNMVASHGEAGGGTVRQPVKNADAKVGRNELCPCGSGKKYKKCCGA